MADEENISPPGRGQQYTNFRSSNSINWRVKDDSARQDGPPQGRFRRDQNNEQSSSRYHNRNEYQPREPRDIPSQPDSPRLYVGNLLYTAQAKDITDFFATNGFSVVNVSMSIDPVTGRNPSYCFVDLESVDDAVRAMESLNGAEVMGRSVRINPGVARKEGGMGSMSGGPRRGGWRERDSHGALDSSNSNPRSSNDRGFNSNSSQSYSRPPPSEQGKRIYIGGLPPIEPQSAVETEISHLFSRADPPIEFSNVSNLIAPHASKANEPGDHHYLFVDLKGEDDAERAIELFNDCESPWNAGGRLRVNRAREARERGDRDGRGRGGGNRDRDGGQRGWGTGRGSWRSESHQE